MNLFRRKRVSSDSVQIPATLQDPLPLKIDCVLELLGCIMEDVESFDHTEAAIAFAGESIVYSFENREGTRAEGSIHHSAGKPLREFLQLGVHSLGFRIFLPSKRVSRILRIENPGEFLSFRLCWHEEDAVLDIPRLSIVADPVAVSTSQENIKASKKPGKKVRSRFVLVVEDNSAFAQVLSRFLKRHEISATFAQNAPEAIEILSREPSKPALIVCDVHMPGMDGLEFLAKLRADSQLLDIPLIMLTADDSIETKIRAIAAGAEAFLTKSEDPRLLCAHVTRILTRGKKREAA